MSYEFADRLIELRRSRALSQEDLAGKIGVSRQAVSKWERAESAPDIGNLMALSELYEISLDELVRGEEAVAAAEASAEGATSAAVSFKKNLTVESPDEEAAAEEASSTEASSTEATTEEAVIVEVFDGEGPAEEAVSAEVRQNHHRPQRPSQPRQRPHKIPPLRKMRLRKALFHKAPPLRKMLSCKTGPSRKPLLLPCSVRALHGACSPIRCFVWCSSCSADSSWACGIRPGSSS